MWGGVKARKHYGDYFRHWTATKGLDELRRALYQEPRPWFLAFSLHQRNHLLQDHHGARLLSWSTTIVQLRDALGEKQEAYRYAQEMFGMLASTHKVGKETLLEYMRLCAVGKDLTTAYEWHKFWLDSKQRDDPASTQGAGLLQQYEWLLRIALESPSDESAEDMATAVMEGYSDRCCVAMEHEETGERVLAHFSPTNAAEEEALRGLFCGFKAVALRLGFPEGLHESADEARKGADDDDGVKLRAFMAALPVSRKEATDWLHRGWPTPSHSHNFPQLEANEPTVAPTPAVPKLRDSLLSQQLVARLEKAAFVQRNVPAVIEILKWYQEAVTMEREKQDSGTRRLHQRKLDGEALDVWRQYADATARHFRSAVVEAGGLTPELYHYVISALAPSQPTAALRTLQRMREANLRILDVTRAVAIVAAQGSFNDQLQLFQEQLSERAERHRLDEDFDISKRIEVYWKYQYTDFFHYMNAMDEEAFYGFLMEGLQSGEVTGPHAVQQLLLHSQHFGPTATEEDLVALDDALRKSAATYFRRRLGAAEVDAALDIITRHMPKLDISLMGSLPHFSDYTLREADGIATDVATLAEKLRSYDAVYVLDTSFVETGEAFLELMRGGGGGHRGSMSRGHSLVLLPYVTLAQLADSVENANGFVSFDPALSEAVQREPLLAAQRLRALYAATQSHGEPPSSATTTPGGNPYVHVRPLHFTECLLAHRLPPNVVTDTLALSPATSDNDHLLLVLALLSTTVKPGARLVLCSDDAALVGRLTGGSDANPSLAEFFRVPVEVLSTQAPATVDVEGGVINDNPVLDMTADDFTPKMAVSQAIRASVTVAHDPAATSDGATPQETNLPPAVNAEAVPAKVEQEAEELAVSSPWLSLLEDDADGERSTVTADSLEAPTTSAVTPATVSPSPPNASTEPDETALAEKEEALMNLYATPMDVEPIGVKMREASELGSVFSQFDVLEPEELEQRQLEREARRSRLQHSSGVAGGEGKKRRRSVLEKEMLRNRGASYRERQQMARRMSNMAGGRVPFNFRYKVVEADIRDPRNAALRRTFEDGVRKSREVYRKKEL